MKVFRINSAFCGGHFETRKIRQNLEYLSKEIQNPNLWEDLENARKINKEYTTCKEEMEEMQTSEKLFAQISEGLNFEELEMLNLYLDEAKILQKKIEKAYLNTLFSNEADSSNCFLTVHCGSGGQESEDWTRILWEMYLKYTNRYFDVSILDIFYSDEGLIKNATMKISAREKKYPFGWFKSETGVHRLVRISPFDKKKQRHTSFASVAIMPEIDDKINVDIEEKDLRIDTYRSSGAGGQHVNKTESAIRITHIPTNIVVQCQNDRSQHKNKEEAMSMLKSKLYQLKTEQLRKEKESIAGEKKEISWGSQIRSYVQQPYQMVKDYRTDFEIPNFDKVVFEGEIEEFLIAFLKKNI